MPHHVKKSDKPTVSKTGRLLVAVWLDWRFPGLTTCQSTNCNSIKRTLLSEDLGNELKEDQQLTSHIGTKAALSYPEFRSACIAQCLDIKGWRLTEGAELAMKIKDPRYAAPL